ncbi:N-terminal C2 in EEIG1 and EHBP1 proteins-domain-containing protein [Roridomyces roridus]|uniref:N-terminal C2 in EEIG1 and EHBP1 proteins-domain-containing protein n=1 Tax=Roridomyces roridus TaxID=1738132 RepID=A0AAD7C7B7_9AGAR|nr:N-terminal C2 in EEIG1 and EHBP1 proteins-domain-containing protein [Roridomyces roridus]
MSSPDQDPHAPGKLRTQLGHLLPRHALFDVRITIHQLASVPLVSGEFGCRWKFKNTKSVKGKERAHQEPEPEPDHDSSGDNHSMVSGEASTDDPHTLSIPSQGKAASDSSLSKEDDSHEETTSARGQTPWVPLREHSVIWEQPLSTVVQMSIERHTHKLLPLPFKLTVLQRVIANDPDAPANPRLGTVELDLAEFADSVPNQGKRKGTVTRRYLLSDSKTNATLRLSVRVEPAPSKHTLPQFVAPPLPLGEILAGVSTLLTSHSEVYRTRPQALDLYSRPPTDPAVFDMRALPRAYGPGATASLIDALFNPAPVRDPRLLSPFTKLVTGEDETTSSAASVRSSISGSVESASSSVEQPRWANLPPSASAPAGLSLPERSPRTRWWNLKPGRERSRSRSRSRVRPATPRVAVA